MIQSVSGKEVVVGLGTMFHQIEKSAWEQAYPNFDILVGQTITGISGFEVGSEEIVIETLEGSTYKLYHSQDCCESVDVEDIDGTTSDLVGGIVLTAEEVQGETPVDYKWEYEPASYTWTFYKISTDKGSVFIRWLGMSNGYYGEGVSFCDVNKYNNRYN